MTTIGLIGLILTLVSKIWDAFKISSDEAKKRNEKHVVDEKKFLEFADAAILQLRKELKIENDTIGDVEDQIDRDMREF